MATHQLPVVIPLNKGKIFLVVLGSMAFIAMGIWIYQTANDTPGRNPLFAKAIGVASVVFFGACGIYAVRKLFDSGPGLIIDGEGLVDNSSGISAGRIPWSDITGITVTRVQSQRYMSIEVRDPEKYYRRASRFKRLAVAASMKFFGGPIHIGSSALAIGFDELVKIVTETHRNHRGA